MCIILLITLIMLHAYITVHVNRELVGTDGSEHTGMGNGSDFLLPASHLHTSD